jgi:hypothetical protein
MVRSKCAPIGVIGKLNYAISAVVGDPNHYVPIAENGWHEAATLALRFSTL